MDRETGAIAEVVMHSRAMFVGLSLAAGLVAGAAGMSLWTGDTGRAGLAVARDTPLGAREAEDDAPGVHSGNVADVLESLTRVLDDEINERRVLAEKIDELNAELSSLKRDLGVGSEEAYQVDAVEQPVTETAATSGDGAYSAAGITPEQLETVRALYVEAQMAGIEVDDRARREGWVDTPRYQRELRKLRSGADAVRAELGDELYDRYLFASGLPNRVMVGSVIETSPAERAGFQLGDVIVRYGGENVYSTEQLVELRSSGVRGEAVAVEILRDGRPLELTIPRGPMGMSTGATGVDPAAPPE